MAVAEQTTYISIPPPPLPEFYLSKRQNKKARSSSSSSSSTHAEDRILVIKDPPTNGDGAYDARPRTVPMPGTPLFAIPPQHDPANYVPPLAIYHICRVCLRTRSARYHREHPIPIDGVPPPPGICRRCRVQSVEDTKKVTEIVTKSESNDIKLGAFTPFLKDEDIVSNQDMRRMKVEKYLSGRSLESLPSKERSKSRDIVYRHVRVVEQPEESPSRRTKVAFTAQDAIENFTAEPMPEPPRAPKTAATSVQVQPTMDPPRVRAKTAKTVAVRHLDSAKASVSTQSKASLPGSVSTTQASAKVIRHSYPERTESDIHRIARDEVERYASTFKKPERTESDIRRISREEVERYRVAERKLEAHPSPYAHGKLVPVERRIEIESDIIEPKPWEQPTKQTAPSVTASMKRRSESTRRSVATERDIIETRSLSHSGKQEAPATSASKRTRSNTTTRGATPDRETTSHSKAGSWGPKWRRELSLERQSRSGQNVQEESACYQDRKDARAAKATTARHDSEPPVSVKLREVYDVVPESDPLRWSSKAEPYVVKVIRKPPEDQHIIIEVVEEIDLPPRSRTASYRRHKTDDRQTTSKVPPIPERVRDLQGESRRQVVREERPPSSQEPEKERQNTWSGHSTYEDGGYWRDEATVRTVDTRSTKQYATSGSGGTQQPSRRESSPPRTEKSARSTAPNRVSVNSVRESEKIYWPKEEDSQNEAQDQTSKSRSRPPYPEEDVMPERIVRPTDTPTERSFRTEPTRSDRPARNRDIEYKYVVRTVQPADRPLGRQPFDHRVPTEEILDEEYRERRRRRFDRAPPQEHHSERSKRPPVERTVHSEQSDTRRRAGDAAPPLQKYRDKRQYPPNEAVVHEEEYITRRRHADEASPEQQRRERHRQKGRDLRDSEESNHVRFNSKVDVSPTPPGSDASSSAFRSYHSFGRGSSRQVDGPEDSGAAKYIADRISKKIVQPITERLPKKFTEHIADDLAAKHERRGRTRSRVPRSHRDDTYAPESLHEHEGSQANTANSRQQQGSKYASRSHTWVSGGRPLERALSGSPSREELISRSRHSKSDGRGPYRMQEKVTDSMRPQDGSREPQQANMTAGAPADSGDGWW